LGETSKSLGTAACYAHPWW